MKKQINPMVLVLNRTFVEVSEKTQVVIVLASNEGLNIELKPDFKTACEHVKELPENFKVSAFIKAPFAKKFEKGNTALKNAMRHYFPEAAPIQTDESDNQELEVVEAIMPVEDIEIEEVVERKKTRKK